MKEITTEKNILTENSDLLKKYFKDISKYPIYKGEEQMKLAIQMKNGQLDISSKTVRVITRRLYLSVQAGDMLRHTWYTTSLLALETMIPRAVQSLQLTAIPSMAMCSVVVRATIRMLRANGTAQLVLWVAIPSWISLADIF